MKSFSLCPSCPMAAMMIMFKVLVMCDAVVAADEVRPVIKASLESERLYVGEMGTVRLTISAPADADVSVIRQERAYKRHAVRIDLFTPEGNRVPGGLPSYETTRRPDDFQLLRAGKSISMEFAFLARPEKPGRYIVRLRFLPTNDPTIVVEKSLNVTYRDIAEDDIAYRVLLKIPKHPTHPGPKEKLLKLMNVNTGTRHQLLYSLEDVEEPSPYLERLVDLDADSRIVAVRKIITPGVRDQQVWVFCNKGGDLYLLRIEEVTGRIIEQGRLIRETGWNPANSAVGTITEKGGLWP